MVGLGSGPSLDDSRQNRNNKIKEKYVDAVVVWCPVGGRVCGLSSGRARGRCVRGSLCR